MSGLSYTDRKKIEEAVANNNFCSSLFFHISRFWAIIRKKVYNAFLTMTYSGCQKNEKEEPNMYDELTEVDIRKMQEEIDHRTLVLRPEIIEDVKTARAFGDLSENFEYKAAKREKNRNDSRIRYLERMIATAKVIPGGSASAEVGLFDKVEIYYEEDDEVQNIQLVTTLRQNALKDLISKESPVGKALLGRNVGDRVLVVVNSEYSYHLVIRAIEKGQDDDSLSISAF